MKTKWMISTWAVVAVFILLVPGLTGSGSSLFSFRGDGLTLEVLSESESRGEAEFKGQYLADRGKTNLSLEAKTPFTVPLKSHFFSGLFLKTSGEGNLIILIRDHTGHVISLASSPRAVAVTVELSADGLVITNLTHVL